MLHRSKRSRLYVLCMMVAALMLALVPVQSALAATDSLRLSSGWSNSGVVGRSYYVYLRDYTSGGDKPYYYDHSGNLPSGLTLSSTGVITGVPKSAGDRTFTIEVRDSRGRTYSNSYSITIYDRDSDYQWGGYYYNGRYYNYYNDGRYYDYYNDGHYYNYYNDGHYYDYYKDGRYYNYYYDGKYYDCYKDGRYYNWDDSRYYYDGQYWDGRYTRDGRYYYYNDSDRVWNSNHGHYHYNDTCPNGWGVNRTAHMPSASKVSNPTISAYTATAIRGGATLSVTAKSDRDLAQYYYWQYKDPSAGWTYINGAETATYNWSGLVPGKTYEVRAIVRNVDGGVSTSPTMTFTVPN